MPPHRPVAAGPPWVRHPVKLPLLLFESAWKLLWPTRVTLPKSISGDLDAATSVTVVSCSLVDVDLAVTPWRYVWRNDMRVPCRPVAISRSSRTSGVRQNQCLIPVVSSTRARAWRKGTRCPRRP